MKCGTCDGAGSINRKEWKCPDCKGTGVVVGDAPKAPKAAKTTSDK